MKGLLDENHPKRSSKSFRASSLIAVLSISTILIIIQSINFYRNESFINSEIQSFLNKPEIEPVRPASFGTSSNSVLDILHGEEFKLKSLKKFTGAIQIETESYDDNPDPEDDMKPWVKFYKFHDYLKKTFPLVHEHLSLEKPNNVGLLYTWKGSDTSLKPLFLTAHQDVVPVDPAAVVQWTYPPYSAYFDGDKIWGRGTSDCKSLLIGILEAVETLIEDGFVPTRTVLLGFGNDEESGGLGASRINQTLTARYGPDSIFALVDEGGSMNNIDGDWYATPATSEKGITDIKIQLTTPGGHSSVPPDHTSIGIVSKLITLIESDPFKPILTNTNPYFQLLQEVAKHSTALSPSLKSDILRAPYDENAKQRVIEHIGSDPKTKFLIQTSQAIDIINGGVKSNALPEFVEVVYNTRIALESTINETAEHVLTHVKDICNQFGLSLYYEGEELISSDLKHGYFNITLPSGDFSYNALPASLTSGPAWDVFAGTIKHVWEELVLENKKPVYVAPSIMTGNTDTSHYYKLTPNVYRFSARTTFPGDDSHVHSVDEHIGLQQHLETVAFIYEFIQNVDAV